MLFGSKTDHLSRSEGKREKGSLDLVASFAVLLIPFSSFLGPSNSTSRLILVALCATFIIGFGLSRRVFKQVEEALPLVVASLLFLGIQIARSEGELVFFNYYLGLVIGLFASVIDRRRFSRIVLPFLFIQTALELYEYLTQSFLFDSISVDGSISDAISVRGNEGVFRAKGLADGPTTVGSFLLFLAIMLRGNLLALTLVMLCCVMSAARLGLTLIGTMYLVDLTLYLRNRSDKPVVLILSIIVVFLGLAGAVLWLSSASSAGFLLSALDVESNDNNVDRLQLISYGLWYVSNMDLTEILIGANFNLKNSEVFFESSWLGMIAQSGIFLTGLYLWGLSRKIGGNLTELHCRLVIFLSSCVAATLDPLGGGLFMFMGLGQSWLRFKALQRHNSTDING